jgi:uncharacterized protein YndB with AHSA1/START domain
MRRRIVSLLLAGLISTPSDAQDVAPIVSEAVIDASPSQVWTVWTTSDGLRAWLAPHADIDLRIGGLMRTNYNPRATLGDGQTIENTILAFDPERMLAIRVSRFPDGFPFPNAVGNMWTVVYFEPRGERQTHVRVVALGFGADGESQRMRMFFERGNATTLEQLDRYFSAARR